MTLLRLVWRRLTAMRTALLLLFLLALAAVPGSLVPQRPVNAPGVARYADAHPTLAPILDRLGVFDVFGAPWFYLLYALVAVSLIGCLTPRIRLHARALRRDPPAVPRHLDRLEHYATATLPESADAAIARARSQLGRWRVVERAGADGVGTLSAERGYLRETGNLVFHLGVLALLFGVAYGALTGYRGDVLVVEGTTFTNTGLAYDRLRLGRLVSARTLPPFSFTLDDFAAEYRADGSPADFRAAVDWRPSLDAADRSRTLRVNHPLSVRGARVYLLDHGFAPHLVVRDKAGQVVYDQVTPFLPLETDTYLSRGVVKVPDTAPVQVGVRLFFYPTLAVTGDGQVYSRSPDDRLPAITYTAYGGDLGLDTGIPQSVYALDTAKLVETGSGLLLPGQTATGLAGGATMTFEGYKEFAVFQVAHTPGGPWLLGSVLAILLGILTSLRVRRRRLWVRATPGATGTLVEVGGLPRRDPEVFAREFRTIAARLLGE